jgi:hypothetical protein
MFVVGNVLLATATIVDYVLWLYMWIIIARALISWVNPDPWNPIVQFLERVTEPVDGMADGHRSVADHCDSGDRISPDRGRPNAQRFGGTPELNRSRGMP